MGEADPKDDRRKESSNVHTGAEEKRPKKARRMEVGPDWNLFTPTRPRRRTSEPFKLRKAEVKERTVQLMGKYEEEVAKMDLLVAKGRITVEVNKAGRRTYVEKVKNSGY